MEIDLDQFTGDLEALSEQLRSAVCIIGGGVAGLTLAHAVSHAGMTVTLLEAGGREPDPAVSDPFGADSREPQHSGTRKERVCALGGTSLKWGGQLMPLPAHAGWCLSAAELEPYQSEVERLLGVDELPYEGSPFFAALAESPPALLKEFPSFDARLSKFIPFTRRNLAATLGGDISRSPRVRVVLHAPVVELVLAAEGDRLEAVSVALSGGRRVLVRAERYVLAAGTVESCRLLLTSDSVAREGVGNKHGQVGKNFHDHLTVSAAELQGPARARVLEGLRPWITRAKGREVLHSLKLEPGDALRKQLGLERSMVHVTVEEPEDSGVGLLRRVMRLRQAGQHEDLTPAHLLALPGSVAALLRFAWAARAEGRRYVSARARVFLQINSAQTVPSTSRILLGSERCACGLRCAAVEWRAGETEVSSIRRLARRLRENLTACGLVEGVSWMPGVLEGEEGVLPGLDDARHAMGGACMGVDPRVSVVDPELRVHGMTNFSIASAAVFPDGAAQLPTLTLMALTLRLAERLRRELAGVR